jgi:hypothetical protein
VRGFEFVLWEHMWLLAQLLTLLKLAHQPAGANRTSSGLSCSAPFRAVNCAGHSIVEPPPKVQSAVDCCALCAKTARCTVWNWNTANKLCYPKLNATAGCSSSAGQLSGGALPPRPSPAPGPAPAPVPKVKFTGLAQNSQVDPTV